MADTKKLKQTEGNLNSPEEGKRYPVPDFQIVAKNIRERLEILDKLLQSHNRN